jgi:6-phosphogluconolactonase
MRTTLRAFATAEELYPALTEAIVARLKAAIDSRAFASIAACGGTTPAPLYELLSATGIKWNKVTLTLTDERWVPPESERSNERFLRTHLLKGPAANVSFVPLKTNDARAAYAEAKVHARIARIRRPFDVTLLGMGNDGHTASLIPDANGLAEALDIGSPSLAKAIIPPAETALGERMTLTLRALLDSRAIFILVRGEEKREAFERAMENGSIREAPVRAVLRQIRVPVETFWAP